MASKPTLQEVEPWGTYYWLPRMKTPLHRRVGWSKFQVWQCCPWSWTPEQICNSIWWKVQRATEGTFPYPWPPIDHRLPTTENFRIVGRKGQNLTRTVRVNFVRVNQSTPNNNTGKYQLSHIWDHILHNTPKLKFKNWKNTVLYISSILSSTAMSSFVNITFSSDTDEAICGTGENSVNKSN